MPSSQPSKGDPPLPLTRLARLVQSRVALQTLSNGVVGFGTSAALAKGMGDFSEPTVPAGDSILALLVGSTLSINVIVALKRRLQSSDQWLLAAGGLAATSGITASLLYALFTVMSENGRLSPNAGWLFFAVLCVYFALAFVSRSCRIEVASRQQQEVGWIESGYALGCAAGLVAWQASKVLDMQAALLINVPLMAVAMACDFRSMRFPSASRSGSGAEETLLDRRVAYAGIGFLVAMTVLVQINTQYLSKIGNNLYLLAAFDVGTLTGSLLAGALALHLRLPAYGRAQLSNGSIAAGTTSRSLPVLILGVCTFAYVLIVALLALHQSETVWIQLGLLFVAAAVFEASAIAFVDWFGKYENLSGIPAVTYGLMSIVGATVYGTLLYFGGGHTGCLINVIISGSVMLAMLFVAANLPESNSATVAEAESRDC